MSEPQPEITPEHAVAIEQFKQAVIEAHKYMSYDGIRALVTQTVVEIEEGTNDS